MRAVVNICWFRRDLRLHDNAALYNALKEGTPVIPLFIFDKNILDDLEEKADRRIEFIHATLEGIQQQLANMETTMEVYYDHPEAVFQELLKKYAVQKVFANHDYELYAVQRDRIIASLLKQNGVSFLSYKDHVIFEKDEVVKDDGNPYTVFTPYSRRWKATLNESFLRPYPTEKYFSHLFKQEKRNIPSLDAMGFKSINKSFPSKQINSEIIKRYADTRDYPATEGTSRLGVHLRFGTISVRALAKHAASLNEVYLNELIWRDFYHMILWHFPRVAKGMSFRPEYDLIECRNNEEDFESWCKGMTGYPIVDAGMRELNQTGFMHNRVRMITASFLAKHLLIDWHWGEAYFAQKLLDFDFAANNGGWQWAAGSGCDAAPYFRIFSPSRQAGIFDKKLEYIKKWVPELDDPAYPKPIVDHGWARKRCLDIYGKALKK